MNLAKMRSAKFLTQPSLLDSIPRFSSETAKELYETLLEHQGLEQVMIGLNQYGFGPQLSMKIYQAYKDETLTYHSKKSLSTY